MKNSVCLRIMVTLEKPGDQSDLTYNTCFFLQKAKEAGRKNETEEQREVQFRIFKIFVTLSSKECLVTSNPNLDQEKLS